MSDERRIKVIVPIPMDAGGVTNYASQVPPATAFDAAIDTNFWRLRDGRLQEVHVYMSGANVLT